MNIASKMNYIDANEAIPHRAEADSFDLRSAWAATVAACRNWPRVILVTTLATVILVILYIIIWPPVYVANVTLVSASDKDPQREQFYNSWAVFRRDDLKTEVQMFSSAPVLLQVIKQLNLKYDDVYHPPLGYAAHLWQVSWPGRAWRSLKETIVPPPADQPTPEQTELANTLHDLRDGVSLDQVGDSNVGKLNVRGPSRRVREVADTVVNVYLAQRRDRFAREAQESYDALKTESDKAHAELLNLEARMQRYYTQNDMLLMFEKDKVEIAQMLAQRSSVTDVKTQLAQSARELATIRRQLGGEAPEVVAGRLVLNNPIREQMRDKLAQLQLTRRNLAVRYLPTSPEIIDTDRQIDILTSQIASLQDKSVQSTNLVRSAGFDQLRQRAQTLEASIAGARAGLAVRSQDMNSLKATVDTIPAKMKASHELGREHDLLEKKYQALEDKLMIAEVSVATAKSAPPSIQVVEYASTPDSASMPKTKLFLIAAVVVGLLMGVALAILLDYFYGFVSRSRLADRRTGLPLYGVVRQDREYADRIYGL